MNSIFSEYEVESGQIVCIRAMPDVAEIKNTYFADGRAIVRGAFDSTTHYVQGGSPVERPASLAVCDRTEIVSDGEDVAELSGLPVPCVARISGPTGVSELTVPDGALLFSAAVPGDYRVQIEAFPVRDWEVYIHAV